MQVLETKMAAPCRRSVQHSAVVSRPHPNRFSGSCSGSLVGIKFLFHRQRIFRPQPPFTGVVSFDSSCRSGTIVHASSREAASSAGIKPQMLLKQSVAMCAAGAVLGPLLDGQHSSHDVLHYNNPFVLDMVPAGITWSLETCWWVPCLFGLAGIIIGLGYPLLDTLAQGQYMASNQACSPPSSSTSSSASQTRQDSGGPEASQPALRLVSGSSPPPWLVVFLSIGLFVLQYWLSGELDQRFHCSWSAVPSCPSIDVILLLYAALHWHVFDGSRQGLFMSTLTAVCGPLIEVALINGFQLYSYTHAQVWGIPTWIPWVYFCGGPAVGQLGRKVFAHLQIAAARN